MTQEIEKKYLLKENGVSYETIFFFKNERNLPKNNLYIQQGYMSLEQGRNLAQKLGLEINFEIAEARLRSKGKKYFFTIKGEGTLSREEQERVIDEATFQENWPLTEGRRIEKVRVDIEYEGLIAEIDFYQDRDLVIAEVECPDIETAQRLIPLGKDITEDKRYKNKNLAK